MNSWGKSGFLFFGRRCPSQQLRTTVFLVHFGKQFRGFDTLRIENLF